MNTPIAFVIAIAFFSAISAAGEQPPDVTLQLIRQHGCPVITRGSPGTQGNKYGFEGGRCIKVGEIDRKKIRDEIAKGAQGTLWGDITWKNQLNANPWAVGQWQGGQMVGIFPPKKHNAKAPLFPKPKWG